MLGNTQVDEVILCICKISFEIEGFPLILSNFLEVKKRRTYQCRSDPDVLYDKVSETKTNTNGCLTYLKCHFLFIDNLTQQNTSKFCLLKLITKLRY